MFIQNPNTSFTHGTLLETLKSITSHPHEAMHCHFVYPIHHNMLSVYHYWFLVDSFKWLLAWVPFECQTWKCWIPSSQVGVHRYAILQSFNDKRPWDLLHDYMVFNHSLNDSKSDRSFFNLAVHSEITWVHKSTICRSKMSIKRHQKLQEGCLFLSDCLKSQINRFLCV